MQGPSENDETEEPSQIIQYDCSLSPLAQEVQMQGASENDETGELSQTPRGIELSPWRQYVGVCEEGDRTYGGGLMWEGLAPGGDTCRSHWVMSSALAIIIAMWLLGARWTGILIHWQGYPTM